MKKVFYLILISLFSLTIISCAKKDDSSSISNSTDNSSVTLNISSFVIDTTLAAGTITGGVLSQDNDSDLSGVSVSFEKSGTTVDTTTTDSSGDFSQILTLGTYTITYSKSGYLDEIQSVTLAADNQTLVASTLKMLPDSCTSGTISGTIKDAVNNNPVTGVSLSVRRGVNVTTGTIAKSDTTSNTGTYSLSSMSAGWYTVETSKSGYITSTFNVYACGNNSGEIMQNTSISTTLDAGAMRIVLSWKTSDDLDAHLTGPDNLSGQGHYNAAHGQFHLYYPSSYRNFYYATNNFSCSGCSDSQLSDNVTLDLDSPSAIGSDGGPETITIGAVRSGTYRYYVQNFSQKGTNNTNLADADTYVKAYCNDNGTTTVTTYNVPNTAGDLWTVFGFNKCSLTLLNEMGSEGSFTVDVFAPKIAEVTAVTTPTGDTTPDYTFSSNEAGTIAYGGSCSSSTTSANADNNTITFNTLSGGTYSNCTITVTDSANNTSDSLSVSSFILDTTAPSLSEVTAVSTPTNDNTSSYTFSSNEAGTIAYGGSCSSPTTAASVGDNTITFNELAENTYSNCTISVTDNVSNTSIALSVTSFTIDTTAPTLSRVTAVSTPINDSTPDYTFSSDEAGTITYGGSCSSSTTAASATSNTITLNALADGPYSNCTVSVTDSAGNVSSPHSINTFTVAVPPTLAEVTAVSNPTKDSTPDYTFSSSEAGTIAYAGNCSSSTTAATASNNTITFNSNNPLADGTHDNCTIRVTDSSNNTSDNLTVTSFTVGALKPALAEVTVVTNPTNDNTPNYTFFSTLSGAITYGGSCSSPTSSAQENNNAITFNTLADNTYDNCTVMVTNGGRESDNLSVSSFTIDTIRPSLSQVTAVTTPTGDNTPDYTFSSSKAGTITYGGSCSSSTTAATVDNNTITFSALADNTYIGCTISVTDNASNTSDNLTVNSFTVDATAPTLGEVTRVSTPDNDSTPNYIFRSNEAGTITYGGSCSSSTTVASVGDNTITFNALADNTYSNCTITVTDNASNTSTQSVNTFIIDTTAPTLSRVSAVSTQINDSTPNYTFSSSEAGTITYGGSCSSSTTAASATNNTITLNALADGPYSNCTVSVIDSAGNVSSPHSINTFTVAVPPTLAEVTAVSNPTKVSTPNYTFSSSEAGTIAYAGNCSSSTTSATATSNTISFNALADGTHDNCTITVTDNNSNTSDNLSVTSFTIGALKPALAEVTVVTNPTNDNTPNYTFFSTLSGTITYGGSCSSLTSSAQENNNTISFNILADETYDNCTIRVTNGVRESDNLSVSSFTIDTTAPSLSEVTAVTTPTGDNTPNYTFSSSEAGTITYGGSCSSSTTTASADNNTITFNALTTDANYGDCTIKVTDNASNQSSPQDVSSFRIDTTAPTLAEVTRVSTPTNDNETSYTFSSNEAGTIAYAGGCTSSTTAATVGNNNINFNALPEDTYSNCTITVTDNLNHTSSALSVSSFIIDTTPPTLSEVTAVTTPTNDTTPSYVFRSNEAGTKSYGGSCGSSSTSATTSGDNTIALKQPDNSTVLSDNTSYSTCTITVTDLAGNPSTALTVNTFVVDTTAPTVSSTSPSDNESSVSISKNVSVTFSESMGTASVTTNTSNTICSGSLQLSSDSFSSCVQMASSPSSSDNRTFTVTSSPKMFYSTTYKIRVTTAAEDSAGNNIAQYTQTYGFDTSITFPTTAGSAHSCYMLDNSSVKCWGKNNLGQLGLGNTSNRGDNSSEMGDNLPVVDLGTGRTAKAIAAGSDHTCAILDNASIKCWGANASGQLGIGDTNNRGDESSEMGDILPAIDLGSGRTATAIAAGGNHTCAILDNESIKCWGKNASGQLGIGDTNNRGDGSNPMGDDLPVVDLGSERTAKVIVAGGSHTCAILDNSAIKCWGGNASGQLGLGDTNNRGDAGSEMGDDLDTVDLGSGRTAVSITAGYGHTCALLDDNSVKCWGRQDEGQLGSKKTFNSGATSGKMGDVLLAVDLGSGRTSTAIAAGGYHSCAILDNSSIKCWGENSSGQLGLGHIEDRGRDQTGDSPCLENLMGDCLQSIEVGTGRTTRGIIAGDNQTCAILDNASIKCWGSNNAGQLGLGDTNNRGDNSSEMGDNLPVISL